MLKRGLPDEVADGLVARYVEVGLLDDEAYARMWVESRMRTRGLGRMALRQELRTRGAPDHVIEEALADVDPDDVLHRGRIPGTAAGSPLPAAAVGR